MAIMIPANETFEDFNHSFGEMNVSELLKKLPENYYIFHSAKWNKRYRISETSSHTKVEWHEADFLVFLPSRGIISIEVKDGGIRNDPARGWVQMNRKTGETKMIDPMYQAQRSMFYVVDLLKEKLPQIFCPVSAAVWFTSADKSTIQGSFPNNYQEETVLWANDLTNAQHVQRKLNEIFDFYDQHRNQVDDASTQAIVNLISPEFMAFESVRSMHMVSDRIFHRMTEEQSHLLDYLEEQDTAAIHGFAGTGKTMIALQKAIRLSESDPVLFLCFNAFLKEDLQRNYVRNNLTITNLDSLYTQYTHSTLPQGIEGQSEKTDIIEDFLLNWQDNGLHFKHIIVDEGQDFANSHLEALHAITLETKGCFYVFYDKHQFVQGASLPSWLDDMDCRLVLNRNCRNTREIALTSTRPVGIDENKIRMRIDFADSPFKMSKPRLFFIQDKAALLETLDMRINKYVEAGFSRNEIVVLTVRTLQTSTITEADYHLSRKNVLSNQNEDGRILFTTVRKFKGLEANVIICVDIDERTFESERNRNAFYVGSSRAKLFLELFLLQESDESLWAMASSIGGINTKNSTRALVAIASGLKAKLEHDASKAL